MATPTCRDCQQPITWQDTPNGRRPFNPDGSPRRDSKPYSGKPANSAAREYDIHRQVALKAAATFCAGRSVSGDVSTKDVLAVAGAFLKWLEVDTKGGPPID
jgi:hypothetical protein